MKNIFLICLCLMWALFLSLDANSRKIRTNIKIDKKETISNRNTIYLPADSCSLFAIKQCAKFTGYDKPSSSASESFFVTNQSQYHIKQINVKIIYSLSDNRELHSRIEKINCDLQPGETKNFSIKAWDKQHSFHYEGSRDSRVGTTPFKVSFIPIGYTILREE